MINNRFANGFKQAWIKVLIGLVVIAGGQALLLYHYGLSPYRSIMDALVFGGLLVGGLFLLSNIFRYYQPEERNYGVVLFLVILLAFTIVFGGNFALRKLVTDDPMYLEWIAYISWLRLAYMMLILSGFAIFMIVAGRLEDQLAAHEREEQMAQLSKEAELYHLRQQLQPHFLFNSLNSISALLKRQPEQAREMILQLSEFLRSTIRKNDLKWVTVAEEINTVRLFLSIEKVRFGHRLEVDIAEDTSVEKCIIPPLLIQPVVENAVKHGVYGLLGKVKIEVEVKVVQGMILISVQNPYDPNGVAESGTGFGLDSVRRRLYLLFGRRDLISVSSENGLFSVVMKIPIRNTLV
ncbi:hypothetical protein GCM10007049_36720 [Echinicola pacifica]|uniref:Signal transduction histidine kinase internal region domain-containing protein n=1 Tax=Echinicola pacifica TaxID=346377 RepID=A0A918UXH5_9BACT|nr:histidine kinase [Echinicola pacifica]GGZ39969.1 hypothetical protein GCM10007049_36720 [Echinicola pacifica]